MSIVFLKNKKKRLRSSSTEANTSFVKNVASKVSGFLPATITKWFNSPSSSNLNGSAPVADTTDSSSEDDATETSIQPPSKRMRYSSPTLINHESLEKNSGNLTETLDSCTQYSIVQSLPGRTTFGRETNFSSTPLRSANDEVQIEKHETEPNKLKLQHTIQSDSVNTKRTSLFCNESMPSSNSSLKICNKNNTVTETKQPCYSPSILGSPFYPGRTVYGGVTSSYINKPNIIQRKATIVNEISSDDNTISHSARRVMDLLEQYSSPLTEAKRIPHYKRNSGYDSFSNSSSDISKLSSYKTQELQVPSIASILRLKKRSRLMNTTSAARQIIASHSSSSDVSPYPSPQTQREQNKYDGNSNFTTKIKTKQFRSTKGDKTELKNNVEVNFPSSALEIDHTKLPQFNFGIETVSNSTSKLNVSKSDNNIFSVVNSSCKGNPTSHIPETESMPRENVINNSNNKIETISKFSSPIRILTSDLPRRSSSFKFTFVNPERSIDKIKEEESVDITISPKPDVDKVIDSKINPVYKAWKCDTCWVSNKEDADKCVCCTSNRPGLVIEPNKIELLNKCSVCKIAKSQSHVDKCVTCENIHLKNNNIDNTSLCKTTDNLKWTCQDCWVKNDNSADKCVCCGYRKPKSENEFSKEKSQTTKINKITSEWKCDICWIKNAEDLDKCAACGGNKPKAITDSSDSGNINNLLQPAVNSFKDITKSQTNQWECTSCLVRNANDKSKCVCCETEKPGTVKETDKKMFNFGVNQNSSFKFGIDAKVQDAIPNKTSNNAFLNNNSKDTVSETNNNVLDKTPRFAFGIPAKKSEDQADSTKAKTEETSKPSFTFGVPKPANVPEMMVPIINTPNKLTETISSSEKKKENLQEVPKVDLPTYTSTDTSLVVKPFESSFPIKTVDNNLSVSSSNKGLENVHALPISQLQSQLTTTSESASNATFKVSVPENKMPGNLFSSLQPNAASSNSFSSPLQSSPVASSLFKPGIPISSSESTIQKNETPISTTGSLFTQSNTGVNKTALSSSSTASPAPIFSFGSGSQTVSSQPDKQKFNFSFGATNKTETSSSFPTTFGTSTDGNTDAPANKFNLPNPNPLENSSGPLLGGIGQPLNALSGSTLPVGSAQSTANILGDTNVLPLNPLLPNNTISTANTSQSGAVQATLPTGIFGTPVQKEIWSPNNNSNSNTNNLFVANASTNNLAKAPTFAFGSSTPFNASATSTFGNNTQTSTIFGMTNQNSPFSNAAQNQPITNMFGSVPNNSLPATANVFGSPNVGAPSSFGTPNAAFETPSLQPAPVPTFNFGSSQSTGVFGFGQQQPQQNAIYSFGAAGGSAPQVQFNMGSHPGNLNVRRVRKAVRRSSQR